jgi:hypothetical protein
MTPLKLHLMHQAMIGNDDLLEEEALELSQTELMQQAKLGATNMKRIAATLAIAFMTERRAIQATYLPQIQALKLLIEAGIANSEDVSDLQLQLTTLRAEMVAEIQALVADFRHQTIQARVQWQTEADNRKSGSQGPSQS